MHPHGPPQMRADEDLRLLLAPLCTDATQTASTPAFGLHRFHSPLAVKGLSPPSRFEIMKTTLLEVTIILHKMTDF